MATVVVAGGTVEIRLTPLEKLLAWRGDVRIPISAVRSATVVHRPWDDVIPRRVQMGLAARGAPLARVATVGPRARCEGGEALVVVYRNGTSLVIDVDGERTGWSLVVVSTPDADALRHALRSRSS